MHCCRAEPTLTGAAREVWQAICRVRLTGTGSETTPMNVIIATRAVMMGNTITEGTRGQLT